MAKASLKHILGVAAVAIGLLPFSPSCSDSDGGPCDPKTPDSCQTRRQQCEPSTSTCKQLGSCDEPCPGGFTCEGSTDITANCKINCEGSDNNCRQGFRCLDGMNCTQMVGKACDPNNGYTDCNGPGCDAVSHTCVDSKNCTEDSQCPDGFRCFGSEKCYRFCTNTQVSPTLCAEGYTCQSDNRCQ